LSHPLRCSCGAVRGFVDATGPVNHGVCYCKDCQAFAHFLGQPADILDALGGTEVVQMLPARVEIATGREHLACVRLTNKGLLRWFAHCCHTPIGNTLGDRRFSFVGLVHNCLAGGDGTLDQTFGPVRMWVHTQSALGGSAPQSGGLAGAMLRVATMMLRARLDGSYVRTPFFTADGVPVSAPHVLSAAERQRLAAAVDAR